VKIGSLFSGIGGLELGLEMAIPGARVVWQAESDPYARAVLAKHWPEVRRYEDVRDIDGKAERPDIICGGFPCQDISDAGQREGITGAKSGLWFEFARVLRCLRPRYAFVENVDALVNRGIDVVLGALAALGFDAEWGVLGACAAGAPHTRERMFILAHANGHRLQAWQRGADEQRGGAQVAREQVGANAEPGGRWLPEPLMVRVAHGFPRPVDRTRALGNAVVPAQAALAWQTLIARSVA
jgi:DNA (cytosine-5)-methyltransferase 1